MKKAIIIIRLYYGYPFLLPLPHCFLKVANDHFAKTGSGQTLWKLMKSLSLLYQIIMAIIMAIPSCATARVLAYGCFRYCVASLPRVSAHAATLDCATLSLSFSLALCFVSFLCAVFG